SVPYEQLLPSGVYDGLLITVQGVVNPDAELFAINLHRNEDIALHINPRFNESPAVIVRNSLIDNTWGTEERDCPTFPFAQGQPFDVQILCTTDAFKVSANNTYLLEYNHRIPELSEIGRLSVLGGVTLQYVNTV
ncbi:hypothetical protein P4O66_011735, partial [Electrophorus voltai]